MAASAARKSSRKTAARKSGSRKSATGNAAGRKTKTAVRKATARKTPARKTSRRSPSSSNENGTKRRGAKRWSQRVTDSSDALDLKQGVFKLSDPKRIAASLKRSAENSDRRKTGAYRSALSMLTFYINRAGQNLPKAQRERLQRAKDELKKQFGRE